MTITLSSPGRASLCVSAAAASLVLCLGPAARADHARPPEPSPYLPDASPSPEPAYYAAPPDDERERQDDERDGYEAGGSSDSARLQIGPAMLLEPTSPGFFGALDFGPRSVGGRLSAAWLRTASEQGLSAYSAELWVDFRHRYDLHPILGAGASWLHGSALGEHPNVGAGVLRGALEYDLPISDADARVGVSGTLLVPAIAADDAQPRVTLALSVGVGF